ncbi:jg8911 [Pararge aegeria aegeria]|uniref:Jg8911 protein n=1 Tax=Pararge aegeria aegeria TaxID=348720 RepID=A0A8S4SFL4_9NEOP|nr:jg8911 [Pararge aegeria aegeria]
MNTDNNSTSLEWLQASKERKIELIPSKLLRHAVQIGGKYQRHRVEPITGEPRASSSTHQPITGPLQSTGLVSL